MRRQPAEPLLADALGTTSAAYAALGVGTIREPMVNLDEFLAYQEARDRELLNARVRAMIRVGSELTTDQAIALVDELGARSGSGDDWLRIWGLKFVMDGGVEGAAMEQPYANDPGNSGHLNWEPTAMTRVCAVRHLSQARELADRFSYHWPAIWSRVQLGTLGARRGRLDQARNLLDEALDLSLAGRSTLLVTLCQAAHARLAFGEGDLEHTALLEGAADGLRRRVGLRAWPMLRPTTTELMTRLRQALGADRLDEVFSAGSRLTRQQAVAAVKDRRGASMSGQLGDDRSERISGVRADDDI